MKIHRTYLGNDGAYFEAIHSPCQLLGVVLKRAVEFTNLRHRREKLIYWEKTSLLREEASASYES